MKVLPRVLCWICERPTQGNSVVLPEENHVTACCDDCIKKIKDGRKLSYKRIL